ncbi:hypothetical protein DL98DRAFT_585636 [Cadophora sp. DSE1049]|nr:hypothetical protein DL98DRAFT_585636 [Cadophora sp. DSE1049]
MAKVREDSQKLPSLRVDTSAEFAIPEAEKIPRSAGPIDSSKPVANIYFSEDTLILKVDGSSISSEPSKTRALTSTFGQDMLHTTDQTASGQHGPAGSNLTEYSLSNSDRHSLEVNPLTLICPQTIITIRPEELGSPKRRLATVDHFTTKVSKHQRSQYQLEQWAYENCHSKMSLAERLEKSNWEVDRLEKL